MVHITKILVHITVIIIIVYYNIIYSYVNCNSISSTATVSLLSLTLKYCCFTSIP